MRPLKAVIIAAKKTGLKIRTESGLTRSLGPQNKEYYVGQQILVAYDFTKNKVTKIIKEYSTDPMLKEEEDEDWE